MDLGFVIYAILFGLFLFIMVSSSIRNFRWGRSSNSWPTATGVIIQSEMTSHKGEGTTPKYGARLLFEYQINGKYYRSFRRDISAGSSLFGGKGTASRILEKYPVGKEVDVFFPPNSPDMGILEPGVKKSTLIFLFIGLIATLVYLFVLILVLVGSV
jgi:hypothetical protein